MTASRALSNNNPTPAHDSMVAWVHQGIESGAILQTLDLLVVKAPSVQQAALDAELRHLNNVITSDENADWQRREARERWNKYRTTFSQAPQPKQTVSEIQWEHPIDNNRGTVVGYVDLYVVVNTRNYYYDIGTMEWHGETWRQSIYFEAKPEIPSVGELLRQINKYRYYRRDSSALWVVVSPETKYGGLLNSQSVDFIASPPIAELLPEVSVRQLSAPTEDIQGQLALT